MLRTVRYVVGAAVAVITVMVIFGCATKDPGSPPQVYYNANVYTSDGAQPSATAFVVEDGSFVYVGNDSEALQFGPGTDLKGARVIPGMIDAHCHAVLYAAMAGAAEKIINLNQDIFAVDPADLKDVAVAATYFRGDCVYKENV
jgi:predicted amidohydrolase YtcJ